MSVPVGKRREAEMEFLKTAHDIECKMIDLRINKPKRYTFFFDKLLDLSFDILTKVKAGNSIYPDLNKPDEINLRALYFKDAIALCYSLGSQIEVVKLKLQENGIPIGMVKELAEMLTTEIRLLKGVLAKDKERYKQK